MLLWIFVGYPFYIYSSVYFGEGNGNSLQYSCLENPMDGGGWWAAIHGVAKSPTRLHFHFSLLCIGEGNGNALQRSCLENPRDRWIWWAAIYGVAQSWTRLKGFSSSSNSSSVYLLILNSQFIPSPDLSPLLIIRLLSVSGSVLQISWFVSFFFCIPHVINIIWYLSLSDLLHLGW